MSRSVWFLLLPLIVAMGCAQSGPGTHRAPLDVGPLAMGSKIRITDQVVVITDASLTMMQQQNFPEAKALTQSFVRSMPDRNAAAKNPGTYDACLVGFGGRERTAVPLGNFDRARLSAGADSLVGLGSLTPLDRVLDKTSLDMQGRRGRMAVVLFSDGVPDNEASAVASAQALIDAYPDEVCIHTVHTGTDPQGSAFLKQLSELTRCGSARTGGAIASASTLNNFTSDVFLGAGAPLPQVAAAPCETRIVLRGINFEFDRAEIRAGDAAILDAAVSQLAACSALPFSIEGHTDAMGTDEYNVNLSNRRAAAVRQYMIDRGIDASRLATSGHGEGKPVGDNSTNDGRAQNRRVTLTPTY